MCTMYTHMYTYTRLCTLPLHNQRPSTFPPRRSFPQGATSWRSKGETTGARRRKLAGQEAKCLWTEGEIIQEPTGPPTPQIVKPTHGNRTRLPVMLSLPRWACFFPGPLGPSSLRDSAHGVAMLQWAHPRVSFIHSFQQGAWSFLCFACNWHLMEFVQFQVLLCCTLVPSSLVCSMELGVGTETRDLLAPFSSCTTVTMSLPSLVSSKVPSGLTFSV